MATPEFSFESAAYSQAEFTVVGIDGSEGISSLFQFDIELKCPDTENIDLKTLLAGGATLSLKTDHGTNVYSGMLAWVEQKQVAGGFHYFRLRLVPPVWKLSLNTRSAAFINEAHPTIAEQVLSNAGLAERVDFDSTDVIDKYPEYDFTCQYVETDLNFVCRLLEHWGVYFYFSEKAGRCQMVLADSASYEQQPFTPPSVAFTDPSSTNTYDSVVGITRHQAAVTGEVSISGYNYQKVTVEVAASTKVQVHDGEPDPGTSEWLYDHRVQEPDDAEQLAKLRAQEQACWAVTYTGQSTLAGLRSGYTFTLTDHPAPAFNGHYLVTQVLHSARNLDQDWGTRSYDKEATDATHAYYSNQFTAVPAEVQFRPRQLAPKPQVQGLLSARVYQQPDAAGTSGTANANAQYLPSGATSNASNAYQLIPPPIDALGRYLVTLPFVDGSVPNSSEAVSAWIRMAQPSGGVTGASQYTLEAGAEVLLAFVNGDPDLPVICGSVFNGVNVSWLTSLNIDPQLI